MARKKKRRREKGSKRLREKWGRGGSNGAGAKRFLGCRMARKALVVKRNMFVFVFGLVFLFVFVFVFLEVREKDRSVEDGRHSGRGCMGVGTCMLHLHVYQDACTNRQTNVRTNMYASLYKDIARTAGISLPLQRPRIFRQKSC